MGISGFTFKSNQYHNRSAFFVYALWLGITAAWFAYRLVFQFPEVIDELIVKPLIFLAVPLAYVIFREKKSFVSVGLTTQGRWFTDLYIGIGLGILFAIEGIVVNIVKHQQFSFAPIVPITGAQIFLVLLLALMGSLTEEVLARGFFYTRLKELHGSLPMAIFISTVMYLVLLTPGLFRSPNIAGASVVVFILNTILLSIVNAMIFENTKTLTIPILIHAFWNMTVALYL